jgi:hypothetical protein
MAPKILHHDDRAPLPPRSWTGETQDDKPATKEEKTAKARLPKPPPETEADAEAPKAHRHRPKRRQGFFRLAANLIRGRHGSARTQTCCFR